MRRWRSGIARTASLRSQGEAPPAPPLAALFRVKDGQLKRRKLRRLVADAFYASYRPHLRSQEEEEEEEGEEVPT